MTFNTLIQGLSLDALVDLYDLDTSPIGGSVYRFSPCLYNDGTSIVWNGNTYTPIDCEATGFEWNGQGALPRPTIKFTNVNRTFTSLVLQFDDMLGCQVTRTRTFMRFLDGQSEADPTA